MTSLSNLIKVSQYVPVDILKQLNLGKTYLSPDEQKLDDESTAIAEVAVTVEDLAAEETRRQMLSDAKDFAERQVREASEQSERLLAEAKEQIETWWQERRVQDEDLIEALKSEEIGRASCRERVL